MIIVFYNQGIRYGMVNTVLPLYFLFSLLIILNFIALRTVEYHLILNSCLGLMYCLKSGIPYLDNSDIENNIRNPINSKYFYLHDFEKLTLSSNKSYFSLFYVNSLDAHLDDLHATSDLLGFPFQVIGVSETRENVLRGFKMNNVLHGYNLHSQPSRSAAGGVALYTSKSLNAVKRTDLSVTDEEFETVWVEIKNVISKSILCCCAYRHPSSSLERFTEHIETILHNLARENKNVFITGDFDIKLLNWVNHPASENCLNMMNSNYLLPYILQPTRVTDRSATLCKWYYCPRRVFPRGRNPCRGILVASAYM